ncbi:tetratricopeptide repeat protein [Chryseobacterium sp. 3008163]|uniref:tetratricopeptide repeat protein n=1 Tax=Chryseobacterium sp. 3008163 TaxID=2478663 RepID=UPI001013C429|nr:tetratricopeptide repeat protein [Chryseobacterium sp. 3008163]
MKYIGFCSVILLFLFCNCFFAQNHDLKKQQPINRDSIIEQYLKNGAWQYPMFSKQWQINIDKALAILPNDPYLWEQKAMPFFKQKKYELGMIYLDKAVNLDNTNHYLEYRAFIKCIFQRSYKESIGDFEKLQKIQGKDFYVMDHSYNFWLGLCYLQLNNFELAKSYIQKSIDNQKREFNNTVNFYEIFYLGVIEYELENYEIAINYFDKSLSEYQSFSDAKFYKAKCLANISDFEEALKLFKECEHDYKMGYTFNEGNSKYEDYPYQISSELITTYINMLNEYMKNIK